MQRAKHLSTMRKNALCQAMPLRALRPCSSTKLRASVVRYAACEDEPDFACEADGCVCPDGSPGCPDSVSVQGSFKAMVEEALMCARAPWSGTLSVVALSLPVWFTLLALP